MTRGTIIIEDNTVCVTGNGVWMTATEIAGLFRTWLTGKALSKEKRQAYVMVIQNGKTGYC